MITFLKRRGLVKFVGLLAVALVSREGFAQKPDAQQATTLITINQSISKCLRRHI